MRSFVVALSAGGAAGLSADAKIWGFTEYTTKLGCECESECETSALFDCDSAMVCTVKDKNCAKGTASWSITKGYYDYCAFPEYKTYDSLPASKKAAMIQERLDADTKSGSYPSGASLAGVFTESVRVSFDASSDVFPQANRKKYIHSVGTVSAVKFVKTGGSYTGLFEGADHGLVRFSAATAPTPKDGFPPGLGMKLFRDGLPSANFMAMPGLDNQACSVGNFFAQNFTNHLHGGDGFAKKLLAAKFWQASYCPKVVGLSDLAAYTQDGKRVEKPEFPFHLNLVPSKGVDVQVPCDDYQQGLRNFASNLKPGTRLFDAYTQATPTSEYELIGYYEVTGSFSTTKFGDDALLQTPVHGGGLPGAP